MNTSSFCPQCGRQFATGANFCSACGTADQARVAAGGGALANRPRLVRPRQPRMLAGVCAGVAIFFGLDVSVTRILFAVAVCLTSGMAALLYFIAWILIPEAHFALPASAQRQGNIVS